MNAVLEQINSAGDWFVGFAVPMLVQSSVLIAVLLLADLVLRRRVRAVFRYWLWMLVLVKLVLPISLSSPVSVGSWFGDELASVKLSEAKVIAEAASLPEVSVAEPIGEVSKPALASVQEDVERVLPTVVGSELVSAEAAGSPVVSVTWWGIVFLVWLFVVVVMGLLLLQRAIFVNGLVVQAKEAGGLMADALKYCCKCIGFRGKVGLKVSVNAASPAVCGLFRPVILVPQDLGGSLGAGGLRAVLLHELAHIKRGDLWVNLIQTVLQIVYFYNPLLWVANSMIRRVREEAVDEMVQVAMGEKAEEYPQTLVNVARQVFRRPALSLRLIGVVESKGTLKGRVKRMLSRPIPKSAKLGVLGLVAVIVIAAVLLPMAKASPPELVIKGTVTDAETGEPIAGAKVFDDGYGPEPDWTKIQPDKRSEWGAITNFAGKYSFLTWPEHHCIKVEMPGYEADRRTLYSGHFTLNKKDEEIFDFALVPIAVVTVEQVMKQADSEARLLNHEYIGTEHILLALASEKSGTLSKIFKRFGIGRVRIRNEVLRLIKKGNTPVTKETLSLTPRAESVIKSAEQWAKALNSNAVKSQHVLLGLLQVEDGVGAQVLVNLGLKLEDVRQEVLNLVGRGPMKGGQPTLAITGIVTDAETGQPVAGAKVGDVERYADGKQWTTTDSDGNYSYLTWYEEHGVKAEADGYRRQDKGFGTKLFGSEKEKIINFALEQEEASQQAEFKAALANGVTVELISVCKARDNQRCWVPDGSLFSKAPYYKSGAWAGSEAFEFAFRVKSLDEEQSATSWKIDGKYATGSGNREHPTDEAGKEIADLWVIDAKIIEGVQKCDISFGVAAGLWQSQAKCVGIQGMVTSKDQHPYIFSQAYVHNDMVCVTVSDEMVKLAKRLIAIDNNGNTHLSELVRIGSTKGLRQSTFGFKNLKLKDVKEFQFQTQPYEWVEFKNVSLKSGVRTDVEVAVKEQTQMKDRVKSGEETKPAISQEQLNEAIYKQLDEIVDLSALTPEMPFGEAIEEIKYSVEPPLNIVVLWGDLFDNADIDKTTPINIDAIPAVRLGTALKLLLRALSTFGKIDYVVEDGVIYIATVESLPRKYETRVYDVGAADAEYIAELVALTVEPESWGRGKGMMTSYQGGKIVVFQTSEIHRKIEELLQGLRLPVDVEVEGTAQPMVKAETEKIQSNEAKQIVEQDGPMVLAREFVRLLVKGEFSAATKSFDATMRQAMPPERLADVWEGLVGQSGAFKEDVGVRTEKMPGFDIVYVTCEFEKGPLDIKVVYDRERHVSGLWFVPVPQEVLEGYKNKRKISSGELGAEVEVESEVSKLLTDIEDEKYAHTRSEIIPLVEEIGNKEPISFLVEQLQTESRQRRCKAALVLELLGDRRGVPAIIEELNDTSYRPTEKIKSDGTEDQEGQVRHDHYYAALLLGILGDERAVPALIEATRDETIDYQAATSLGQIGDKRAIPSLRDMLERCSDKPFPRLFAGYGLAMLGDAEGLKVVINTLNNQQEHWTNRRHAIEALGELSDKEAVPYLIAVLKDEHPNIRVSAAEALGEIGDASALPALKQALKDKTETRVNAPTTVSEAVAKAIAQVEGATTEQMLPEPEEITVSSLADICERMESAFHDITVDYEWYNEPPLAEEHKTTKETVTVKGRPRYQLQTARPFCKKIRFVETTTLQDTNGNTWSRIERSCYNGKTSKHLSMGDFPQPANTATVIEGRRFVPDLFLSPLRFSIFALGSDLTEEHFDMAMPLDILRSKDKTRVHLYNSIEKINGFDTIRADFLHPTKQIYLRIYFSVGHSYTPVRWEYIKNGSEISSSVEVNSLQKVADGLWFPSSGIVNNHDKTKSEYKAIGNIVINQGLKQEDFDIEFPTGTQVDDQVQIFGSYFPDNMEEGKKLDEWWKNKDSTNLDDDSFFDLFRKGLRRCTIKYKDNFLMQYIGGTYIWHKEPDDPRAVDIVYHASFSPQYKYYAVYSGLSVASPKSKKVLRRLAELAVGNHQVDRIVWGVHMSGQQQEFMGELKPYLEKYGSEIYRMADYAAKAVRGEIRVDELQETYRKNWNRKQTAEPNFNPAVQVEGI